MYNDLHNEYIIVFKSTICTQLRDFFKDGKYFGTKMETKKKPVQNLLTIICF